MRAVAQRRLSGWILDPDRKQMSEVQGSVVAAGQPVERYGSDVSSLGGQRAPPSTDTAFD